MPEILLAKTAGYCFGVRRAVNTAIELAEKHRGKCRIYTLGPLIHNQHVIDELESKGVTPLKDETQLDEVGNGILVIRSHGVSRHVIELLQERGIRYVDATCPFVDRIHKIVCEEEAENRRIVVVGNPEHPEVKGICGWCSGPVSVIPDSDTAHGFTDFEGEPISVVAQTTFRANKFTEIVDILRKKGYDIHVLNTICSATQERQQEAEEIASKVDVMLVIGDVHSSNTQKLFEICNTCCTNTYYVQVPDDLDLNRVRSVKTIGITAGASTPNNIIEEVQNHVRRTDV